MVKCPYCHASIDDDSRWCDQCGKALSWCPSCKEPKKGSSCPRCGELLVPAEKYFAPSTEPAKSAAPAPDAAPDASGFGNTDLNALLKDLFAGIGKDGSFGSTLFGEASASDKEEHITVVDCYNCGTEVEVEKEFCPKCGVPIKQKYVLRNLRDPGEQIVIKEGDFGRDHTGRFPALSKSPYISPTHGGFKYFANEKAWGIIDHKSLNGIWIGDFKLKPDTWYKVELGKTVKIADLEFKVETIAT